MAASCVPHVEHLHVGVHGVLWVHDADVPRVDVLVGVCGEDGIGGGRRDSEALLRSKSVLMKKRGGNMSVPNSSPPPPPRGEMMKRSRGILGLRLAFGRGKEKKAKGVVMETLPPMRAMESFKLWVGSDQVHSAFNLCGAELTVLSQLNPYFPSPTSVSTFTTASPMSPVPPVLSPVTFPTSPLFTQSQSAPKRLTTRFRRTSTHALESLAFTDAHALSSSAIAELTSRLSMYEDPTDAGTEEAPPAEGVYDPYEENKTEHASTASHSGLP